MSSNQSSSLTYIYLYSFASKQLGERQSPNKIIFSMITILQEILRQIQYILLDRSKHALINYFHISVCHLSVMMALKIFLANMRGGYMYICKREDI